MGVLIRESIDRVPLEVASAFAIRGSLLESRPFGGGHINDTFVAAFGQAGTRVRYLLQRINDRIFREPSKVMENIGRVCAAAAGRLKEEGVPDSSRRTLTVVEARGWTPLSCRCQWSDMAVLSFH